MKFAIVVGRAIGLAAAEELGGRDAKRRAGDRGWRANTAYPRPGTHDHGGASRFTGLSISPGAQGIPAPVPGDRVQPPSPALGRVFGC
jgi:hypothetical protein